MTNRATNAALSAGGVINPAISTADGMAFISLPRSRNAAPCAAGPTMQTEPIRAAVPTLDENMVCDIPELRAASALNGDENIRYIAIMYGNMPMCICS